MNNIITLKQYETLTDSIVSTEKVQIIEALISVVSDLIEGYIGYDLEMQQRVENYVDDMVLKRLWVKFPPLSTISIVNLDNKDIKGTDYNFNKRNITLLNYHKESCCCCTNEEKIKLVYDSGYILGDNGNVPKDLQYYIAQMVRELLVLQEDDGSIKYTNYKINDIAYTYSENKTYTKYIIPIIKRLLF